MINTGREPSNGDDGQNRLHDLVDAINGCARFCPPSNYDLHEQWGYLLGSGIMFGLDRKLSMDEPVFEKTFTAAAYFVNFGMDRLPAIDKPTVEDIFASVLYIANFEIGRRDLDAPIWGAMPFICQLMLRVERSADWTASHAHLPTDVVDMLSRMPMHAGRFDRKERFDRKFVNLWSIMLAHAAKRAWMRSVPSQPEYRRNGDPSPRGAAASEKEPFEELFRALVAQLPPTGAAWNETYLNAWLSTMHQAVAFTIDAAAAGDRIEEMRSGS